MDSKQIVSLETLNKSFESAVQHAAKLNVPNQSKLDLYALYKQATQGDCLGAEPSRLRVIESAKWHAWKQLQGTTEASVKQAYLDMVRKLDPTYDPEAKSSPKREALKGQEKDINIVLEDEMDSDATRVIIQEESQDSRGPVTLASLEIPSKTTPVSIEIERTLSGSLLRTSTRTPLRNVLPGNPDSPLPTWAVFLLGVLFLCFLDDNLSLGNILLNGLGVSLLTAALISLQIK